MTRNDPGEAECHVKYIHHGSDEGKLPGIEVSGITSEVYVLNCAEVLQILVEPSALDRVTVEI